MTRMSHLNPTKSGLGVLLFGVLALFVEGLALCTQGHLMVRRD